MQLTKTSIRGFAAAAALVAMVSGCQSNIDELIQTKGTDNGSTETTGLTAFTSNGSTRHASAATRTSMSYPDGAFYWENADKIYVLDDNNAYQRSRNSVSADKQAGFKFMVPGAFANSNTYMVFYPGVNGTNNNVTIAENQTQNEPNSTKHFGEAGDCGMAIATKNGGQFEFKLDHKAAYLCFLPKTKHAFVSTYIEKIEVTSDNFIAGNFTLDPTTKKLTGQGTKQTITLNLGGTANPKGFKLESPNAQLNQNGAFMVIKPGAHKLTIKYYLKDVATQVGGVVTKVVKSKNYEENKFYDISQDINVRDYNSQLYYMWDAEIGYDYWKGKEAKQPKVVGGQNNIDNPKDESDQRWYNTVNAKKQPQQATRSAANCPNANECVWYTVKGDPHWDETTMWTKWNHLYKGGMWLKNQETIRNENGNVSVAELKAKAPNGTDYRTAFHSGGPTNNVIAQGRPADVTNYFFLPASGCYTTDGRFGGLGTYGYYWTSTAYYRINERTNYLYFNKGAIFLANNNSRAFGQNLWKAE